MKNTFLLKYYSILNIKCKNKISINQIKNKTKRQ